MNQRLRVRFRRGEELKFIAHLDIVRLWERATRRAGIPLAYSEGFTPHPRLAVTAPLPLGVIGEAEMMDVYLTRYVPPQAFVQAMKRQLPPGIEIVEVATVPLVLPSLQSQVRYAEYEVEVDSEGKTRLDVEAVVQSFLDAREIPWHHQREETVRHYDLRALVDDLWVAQWQEEKCVIGMRLRCDTGGAGRPDQVMAGLGFAGPPLTCRRTRLLLSQPAGVRT